MIIDPKKIHPRSFYSFFTGSLSPRPIAWITTKNDDNSINLAPYSFFSGINTRPPIIMVSIGNYSGVKKHTSQNIIRNRECVINIVDKNYLEKLNLTGKKFDKNVSELTHVNLKTKKSEKVSVPSVSGVVASFECVLFEHHKLPSNDVFYLEVISLFVDDKFILNGQINTKLFKPLARFMGNTYAYDYKIIKTKNPNK
jgi:flavin reductase (DIM6/NTAB) family NADH-FMN oxidoreductase RutF